MFDIKVSKSIINNYTKICMTAYINLMEVGIALLDWYPDMLKLNWIEVNESYQHQGIATALINHIKKNILTQKQKFIINVVDEQVLPFYYHWLKSDGWSADDINPYVKYGEHPEIELPANFESGYSLKKSRL